VVGDGHCVALCREAARLGHTSLWRRGHLVRAGEHLRGTVIATFGDDHTYENKLDSSSHCALLLGETDEGLRVLDQWQGHSCRERLIRFKGPGAWPPADNGDAYYVVETVPATEA
jgi:hypothetical protein